MGLENIKHQPIKYDETGKKPYFSSILESTKNLLESCIKERDELLNKIQSKSQNAIDIAGCIILYYLNLEDKLENVESCITDYRLLISYTNKTFKKNNGVNKKNITQLMKEVLKEYNDMKSEESKLNNQISQSNDKTRKELIKEHHGKLLKILESVNKIIEDCSSVFPPTIKWKNEVLTVISMIKHNEQGISGFNFNTFISISGAAHVFDNLKKIVERAFAKHHFKLGSQKKLHIKRATNLACRLMGDASNADKSCIFHLIQAPPRVILILKECVKLLNEGKNITKAWAELAETNVSSFNILKNELGNDTKIWHDVLENVKMYVALMNAGGGCSGLSTFKVLNELGTRIVNGPVELAFEKKYLVS